MHIPISRRWQEITWLLPCLSRAKLYTSLSYIGFRVSISGQGLDNQCSKGLHPTPNLMQQYICNNNTLIAFRKWGGLICSGACLSQSCTNGDPGNKRQPRLTLLLRAAPPEPPVLAAVAPRSVPRIPAVSHLPVHLLHVDAQDKYHGYIRNDMMLMMNEYSKCLTKASLDTRLPIKNSSIQITLKHVSNLTWRTRSTYLTCIT